MKIRNLNIIENEIPNQDIVIDGIQELDLVIQDNYDNLSKSETAIEFNIGSQVGEIKKYLVIYNNPIYRNNPYYFILQLDEHGQKLVTETSLDTFQDLEDLDARRYFHKKIVNGFKMLPKHRFLGEAQIVDAREFARNYDQDLIL